MEAKMVTGFAKRMVCCGVSICMLTVAACAPVSAKTVKAGTAWKKAAAVKKGTTTVKQPAGKNGFVKFKVPTSKTWKFSFRNVRGTKNSAVYGKFYLAEGSRANKIAVTNTTTGKKITYWPLSSQAGWKSGYNTYVDLYLPLSKGQVIYACYKASSSGKSFSYRLKIR